MIKYIFIVIIVLFYHVTLKAKSKQPSILPTAVNLDSDEVKAGYKLPFSFRRDDIRSIVIKLSKYSKNKFESSSDYINRTKLFVEQNFIFTFPTYDESQEDPTLYGGCKQRYDPDRETFYFSVDAEGLSLIKSDKVTGSYVGQSIFGGNKNVNKVHRIIYSIEPNDMNKMEKNSIFGNQLKFECTYKSSKTIAREQSASFYIIWCCKPGYSYILDNEDKFKYASVKRVHYKPTIDNPIDSIIESYNLNVSAIKLIIVDGVNNIVVGTAEWKSNNPWGSAPFVNHGMK